VNARNIQLVGFIVILLLIIGIGIWTLGSEPVSDSPNRVLQVAYLPTYHSLPLFVAVEQGLFEQEGLKVELQRIETPQAIIDGLVLGRIDAGAPSIAAGITSIVESKSPGAIKGYALNCSYSDQLITELLVPVDSSVHSVEELKGKKIAYVPGVQWKSLTQKSLLVNGVNPDEVTLIELPFSNQLQALASQSVDAVFTMEPMGTIGVSNKSAKILVSAPIEKFVVDPWCGGIGALSAKFIARDPVAAEKFVSAMKKAFAQTDQNQLTRQYLVSYLSLPQSAVDNVDLPKFYAVNDLNSDVLGAYQEFADLFFELKVTEKKIDVRNLMWDENRQ